MEFGLFAIIGVIVLAVIGSLLAKGHCCGTEKDKGSCGTAPAKSTKSTKSNTGFEDSVKEKAIDELTSK